MAKLLLFHVLVGLGFVLTCTSTMYIVGDNSGWDISTDLDSWVKDKVFEVGDVLVFQYSSSHDVSEVNQDSFNGCNVTNAIRTSSDGNTSIPLSAPGERYFVCGNKLHCLGGMKLPVIVNQAMSPSNAPESGEPSARPSSKNNNPLPNNPASIGFVHGGRDSLVIASLHVIGTLLWVLAM